MTSLPLTSDLPFTNSQELNNCPFKLDRGKDKKLKLFVFGDTGTGKTCLGLQFPNLAMVDMEGGADLYQHEMENPPYIIKTNSPDELNAAVDWLLTNSHPFRSLLIDPITVYWEALQKKYSDIFLIRKKGSKGFKHEFYDLQPKDWLTIKSEMKDFIRKLHRLDMNVICTAREKPEYAEGDLMRKIGITFDGEKSFPYMFDTVVRLFTNEKGEYLGESLKHRSMKNQLPKGTVFKPSYEFFAQLIGKILIDREAEPMRFATQDQIDRLNNLFVQMALPQEIVLQRLQAYDANGVEDLTTAAAHEIITKCESALGINVHSV